MLPACGDRWQGAQPGNTETLGRLAAVVQLLKQRFSQVSRWWSLVVNVQIGSRLEAACEALNASALWPGNCCQGRCDSGNDSHCERPPGVPAPGKAPGRWRRPTAPPPGCQLGTLPARPPAAASRRRRAASLRRRRAPPRGLQLARGPPGAGRPRRRLLARGSPGAGRWRAAG